MKEIQHKYLEKKIQKIDKYDHSNYDDYRVQKPSSLPQNSQEFTNMMTIKVKNVPFPTQSKKKKSQKQNMPPSNNFSFMPESQKKDTPIQYERKFKSYLNQKKF